MSWRAAALGTAAGALYWLGLPGHGGWGFAALAFAPLAAAALRGTREGAVAGGFMGLSACATSMAFVPTALAGQAQVGPALAGGAWAALTLVSALPFAALGAGSAWLAVRRAPVALVLALGHAAMEQAFPWPLAWSFAASFVDAPVVTAWLDLLGAPLVGAAAVALSAALGAALARRAPSALAVPGAVLTVAVLFALLRREPRDEGPPVSVAAVQPGQVDGPVETRDQLVWSRHATLARSAAERGAGLIVGAEGVVPGVVPASRAAAIAGELPGVSVVGVVVDEGPETFNSALVLDGGRLAGRHDKRWLVPMSERAPEWLARSLGRRTMSPGAAARAIETSAGRLGLGVCYEEMVDDAFGAAVRDGAELLVTVSHDGWFDGTDVHARQVAHARLRAIEHRRWLVRASTSGPSVVIDPLGRVMATAPPGSAEVVLTTARRSSRAPFAAHHRRWLGVVPPAGLAICVIVGEYLRRRSVQKRGPAGREIDSLTAPWH